MTSIDLFCAFNPEKSKRKIIHTNPYKRSKPTWHYLLSNTTTTKYVLPNK